MEREKLFTALEALRLEKPRAVPIGSNFFPHRCLSASLASWSVLAAQAFITEFYAHLGIVSPLVSDVDRLAVPAPKRP